VTIIVSQVQGAEFVIDETKSHITVNAAATGHQFKGYLSAYQAEIRGDAESLKPESAKVTWKFKDLDTKEQKRDEKMLKWLEIDKFPDGVFELTRVFEKEVLGKKQKYALGTISIHGVSKKLVFPIVTLKEGRTLTISGQAALNTEDYGLPIIRFLVMTVKPELTVDFSLTGTIR